MSDSTENTKNAVPENSPERINQIIGFTSPAVWIIFSMVLVLLVAAIIASCTVTIKSTLDIVVTNEYDLGGDEVNYLSGYCTSENYGNIQVGQTVLIGDRVFTIINKFSTPAKVYYNHNDPGEPDTDGLILHEMGLEDGSFIHLILMVPADGGPVQLEDMVCSGKVITGETRLISLLLG